MLTAMRISHMAWAFHFSSHENRNQAHTSSQHKHAQNKIYEILQVAIENC